MPTLPLPAKILMSGLIFMGFLMGLYFLMAAYASSLTSDRSIGYLMVKVRLSSLSSTEKDALINDFNNYRFRTKQGVSLDIERTNAKLSKKNLGNLECTGLMIDFEKEAQVCLASTGTNPLQVILSSCPPADSLAQKLSEQCSFTTGWR